VSWIGVFPRNCDDVVTLPCELTGDSQAQPPASTGYDDITHGWRTILPVAATGKSPTKWIAAGTLCRGSAPRQSCRISCSSLPACPFRPRAVSQNYVGYHERTGDRVLSGAHQRHPNLRVTIDHCFDFLRITFKPPTLMTPSRRPTK
jgi:hypothetical protein